LISKAKSNGSVWRFLILTCLLSWPIWLASGVLPRRGLGAFDLRWLFAQIGVFGPSLAALLVSGVTRKELRPNGLQMLPVLLLPLVFPGVLIALDAPSSVAGISPLPAVVTVAVATVVVLFFSPLNRRLSSPGTGKKYGKPGVGWILLSIVFFPALFLLAWLLVTFGEETGRFPPFKAMSEDLSGYCWYLSPITFSWAVRWARRSAGVDSCCLSS
jgi:hypothetical protein